MTNKLSEIFSKKKVFIPFLTAGDPNITKSYEYISTLIENGADIIEIGIPFPDPIADGPIIMEADIRALKNNYSLDTVFALIKELRLKYSTPFIFLTYLNPIHKYGYDSFFANCEKLGVLGVVIPDLPFEEHGEIKEATNKHNVDIITMIAPSSNKRIQMLSKDSSGFIYLVSSLGITGMRSEITTDLDSIISKIRENTSTPIAIGFGISNVEQAKQMSQKADGIIIGSKIVDIISKDNIKELESFTKSITNAI